jgi:hypothetical protein
MPTLDTTTLADLTLAEKRRRIGQLNLEDEQVRQERARLRAALYAELFPGSGCGPLATEEENEEALRIGQEICWEGYLPNTQAIFMDIAGRTGRTEKWAKRSAGAHIPHLLKRILPRLLETPLIQELTEGGMMTLQEQTAMCAHSPASYLRAAGRNLGIVRQQKMTARAVVRLSERVRQLELDALEVKAKGLEAEAWVATAVRLRREGHTWEDIVLAVKKRRKTVMDTVTAALALVE